ncbi:MAG TPA: M20/M25/M40 family metallo-hydrolase [Ideonella sp.]|uniref:M20/M25/M40 family metallo-hydrolase n=1 Tax=Ideonella sp. TaxID=1929293 RepID=UPI002E3789B5|nr:M20/M25/M40 family metallo-hydrolase [Ideonella sp.]HEX5687992.1 M20/M25/M40 family metallo-hydrolase [Ideonella sp.]
MHRALRRPSSLPSRLSRTAAGALLAASTAAQAAPVWVSMDEAAYQLLQSQRINHTEAERHALPAALGRQAKPGHDALVILRADDDDLPRLSLAAHGALHRCGGFMVHGSREEARQSVAAAERHRRGERVNLLATVPDYRLNDQAKVNPLLPQLKESEILATIAKLQSYTNRYYRHNVGARASNELADSWRALAAGRTDVTVSQFTHKFAQKSVILEIRGTVAPDEIVVIGGHLDSITPQAVIRPGGRAPGADDDASGIATLQEAMRVLLQSGYKPERTIQFIGYAGEEAGLLGSKDIAKAYAAQGRNVVGALQLDMTDYKGSSSDITLISDYTDTTQDDFVAALAAGYLPELKVVRDVCGYACSDHASWTANGYAASFPFEAAFGEDNPHIHTTKDKLAQLGDSAAHALKFARLALAYAVELGSDHGPAAR